MHIVRKLKTTELPILTQLFNYKDIDDMIAENTRSIENGIVDDFIDGVYVCRSEFESPEVDGEILVRHDSSVMGDIDPYSLIGEFIKVRVIGADEYDLIAEPLEV